MEPSGCTFEPRGCPEWSRYERVEIDGIRRQAVIRKSPCPPPQNPPAVAAVRAAVSDHARSSIVFSSRDDPRAFVQPSLNAQSKWLTDQPKGVRRGVPKRSKWDDFFHERAAEMGKQSTSLGDDWAVVGYKVVAKFQDCYFSLWAGEELLDFVLGETVRDQALPRSSLGNPKKNHGICACSTAWEAARQHIPSNYASRSGAEHVILRCVCEGPWIERRPGSKFACSRLTPLEELPMTMVEVPKSLHLRFSGRLHQEELRSGLLGRMDSILNWDVIGYKVLARHRGGYYGFHVPGPGVNYLDVRNGGSTRTVLLDETSVYQLGVAVEDEAKCCRQGGRFVCNSARAAAQLQIPASMQAALQPDPGRGLVQNQAGEGDEVAPRLVIVRCSCGGPFVTYDGGSVACSRITPLEEVIDNSSRVLQGGRPMPLAAEAISPGDFANSVSSPAAAAQGCAPPGCTAALATAQPVPAGSRGYDVPQPTARCRPTSAPAWGRRRLIGPCFREDRAIRGRALPGHPVEP